MSDCAHRGGFDDCPPSCLDIYGDRLVSLDLGATEPVMMETSFHNLDPAVLGLLTGGALGAPVPPAEFSLDVSFPVRRTFWQWLLRRPRRWRRVVVPRARMEDR